MVHGSGRGKRERRTKGQMWQELCELGYQGSYARVRAFARLWKVEQGLAQAKAAFIPLKFQHGEALQFDCNTEYTFIGGNTTSQNGGISINPTCTGAGRVNDKLDKPAMLLWKH
jgi:hypothetical protein